MTGLTLTHYLVVSSITFTLGVLGVFFEQAQHHYCPHVH